MADLRPVGLRGGGELEKYGAIGRRSTLWQVKPALILQSHLDLRVYTACYHIDCCIDSKQPATV